MKPEKNNNGIAILIAEDSRTQAEQLGFLLEQHGYQVNIAADGKLALQAAQTQKFDLIISDILMPEMDGYELCNAIKSDEKLKDIPVILVTTLSDAQDVIRGMECGADNFIRKPYDERYLLSRIDYLMMNLELRKNQKMQLGVEIELGGHKHFITAERQQILDLLISTYEQAVHINDELKLREKELTHSNQVLQGLYGISEGFNQMVSEQEVAEMALQQALKLPGIQAGWISIQEGKSGFRILAARNLPPALMAPGALDGDCECRRKLFSGELDSVTNILKCERLAKAKGDTSGLCCHASVPFAVDAGHTLGIMNLAGEGEGRGFNEEELKVLHGVGNQVAVALERARLYEHLERLVEERTAKLAVEIEEHERAEVRVIRLNRIYAVLSGINTTIVRVREEDELFREACRIAVGHGGFVFAWIGKFDADTRQVMPVAQAGRDDGYLAQINFDAREGIKGSCALTTQALTGMKPVVCNDIASDERMAAWRSEALSRGYRSVVVLPLILEGKPVGVFALYASEPHAFDDDEMKQLIEMAGDISYALDYFSREAQRKQAEVALEESRSLLKTVIDTSPMRIFWKDKESRYIGSNPAFARDAGENYPEDLLGKDDFQLVWKEQAELYRADDRRVMDSGVPKLSYDEPLTTPDGKTIWLRTSKVPLRNAENETIGVLGIYEDITERKLSESKLVEQIEELRRWHEATLGREMRTLELKREVNELLGQAGQPPRYPSVQ